MNNIMMHASVYSVVSFSLAPQVFNPALLATNDEVLGTGTFRSLRNLGELHSTVERGMFVPMVSADQTPAPNAGNTRY